MHVFRKSRFGRDEAIELARRAHSGQMDKGGRPYIEHIEAVVENTIAIIDSVPPGLMDEYMREIAIIVAALHDVIEDTPITAAELELQGCPPEAISSVLRLTGRPPGVSYIENIRAIASEGNIVPIVVKLADNRHNGDSARISALPENERDIAERYRRSMNILEPALNEIIRSHDLCDDDT